MWIPQPPPAPDDDPHRVNNWRGAIYSTLVTIDDRTESEFVTEIGKANRTWSDETVRYGQLIVGSNEPNPEGGLRLAACAYDNLTTQEAAVVLEGATPIQKDCYVDIVGRFRLKHGTLLTAQTTRNLKATSTTGNTSRGILGHSVGCGTEEFRCMHPQVGAWFTEGPPG